MSYRVIKAALVAAALALLPVLYLHYHWPKILAFVPIHYGPSGHPNRFVGRQILWNVAWFPTIAYVLFTFFPQVQDGESLFWSSPQQRRARLLAVAIIAMGATLFVWNCELSSRATLGPATPPVAAGR